MLYTQLFSTLFANAANCFWQVPTGSRANRQTVRRTGFGATTFIVYIPHYLSGAIRKHSPIRGDAIEKHSSIVEDKATLGETFRRHQSLIRRILLGFIRECQCLKTFLLGRHVNKQLFGTCRAFLSHLELYKIMLSHKPC